MDEDRESEEYQNSSNYVSHKIVKSGDNDSGMQEDQESPQAGE